MEVFLKRSELSFIDKIGEGKTVKYFDDLKKALNLVPIEFSRSIGSEIPKLLFKYSQELQLVPVASIENILKHFIIFTAMLQDLSNQSLKQVNQTIINRSKSNIRNLPELLNNFIEKAKAGDLIKKDGSFEEILDFMIGESSKITQLDELELFVKRSSDNFSQKVDQSKVEKFSRDLLNALTNIVDDLKITLDIEIAKFLYTFSQDINQLSPGMLETILNQIIIFTKSLSSIKGKNKSQIDQEITRRSKNEIHGLLDFFKKFLLMVKQEKITDSSQTFDDLLTSILGPEEKRSHFTDIDGFLKRVENKYINILGEVKTHTLIDKLLQNLAEIPEVHGFYLASDISRYLTTYSETINNLEPKEIEDTLMRSLMYTHSLKELGDLNGEEINQFIINRSKLKIRNLFDLYKEFLKTTKPIFIKSKNPNFDEIIEYTLGKYEGPKAIEEASNIHKLLSKYHQEFPLANEHAKWANGMNIVLSRYLEILQNQEGDQILDQLWNNSYPKEKIIGDFQEKIIELPREDEKLFMFRLMNLLTRQLLKSKETDHFLTGSVAFVILGKICVEIYSGRNVMIRTIKINQLLKDREFKDSEKKQHIDDQINNIIKEDLNAIIKKGMMIKSIIPILTLKSYYIQTYDINRKDFPELIVDMFADVNPMENIGKEHLKTQKNLNTLGNVNALFYYIELVKKFNKYFFKEAETTPLESIKKRKILTEFFERLFDLYDNMDISKFYDNYLIESDRLIYIYILKYLYELSKNAFDLVENFLEENEDYVKVKSMDYYLSDLKLKEAKMNIEQLQEDIKNAVAEGCTDDSEKIIRIKSMLEVQKSDIYKFNFMEDLFNEAKNIAPKLDARILFGKEIFNLLDMVKNINRNLSAVFPEYLNKLNEFEKEIDAVLNEINKLKSKKLISPGEFFEVNQYAENSKKKIIDLMANTIFMEHLRNMIDVFDKIVLYEECIEESISSENISGVGESNELIEEINPLEKFFKKYHEELTAVPSTDSLNKFMDSFNFWLKDEILPLTYNKAEEVLLKLIFKEIKKDYLSELALPNEKTN